MLAYIHRRTAEKQVSARMLCAVLPVSESGFYTWKRNRGKLKAWQKLLAEMHKILDEDEENKNYGVRRMQIALEQRGITCSLSTVRRVMARGNLLHEDRRSPDGLTKADKKAIRWQNIIKQDFSAQVLPEKTVDRYNTDIVQGCKAFCLSAFRLLQWRNHFSCDGYEHEKGTVHKNDNGGI